MSGVSTTPRAKASIVEPATPAPQRAERPLGAHVQASSPHYSTTRRHSLYGTEDRIILDPGSRVWKVGFSGEGRPRDVFAVGWEGTSLWRLSDAQSPSDREEYERQLECKMQDHLRGVFHDSLLTDPKSRKVIIVEHPLLPISIKEMMARILFSNLQVPSISFAPSHLLSLLAVGRMSGLVLDTGHLESTVLPVISSRPLYPYLRTTPLAGAKLSSHIRNLLLRYGTYLPPTTLSGTVGSAVTRSISVPEDVLTDAVIEEIKTRCCFVGDAISTVSGHSATPLTPLQDDMSSVDVPSSDPPSESGVTRSSEVEHEHTAAPSFQSEPLLHPSQSRHTDAHSQTIFEHLIRHSTASPISIKTVSTVQNAITGRGTLIIPGWIRERASEYLFEGDVDESSVAQVILDSLLKTPRDLRKGLISSILVVGGTAMLPGFIPRLHSELVRALTPREDQSRAPGRRPYNPYLALQPLLKHISILNNPSPPPPTAAKQTAGRAPAFSPAALPWVGGSLAGALKTGGEEISRERWDEATQNDDDSDAMDTDLTQLRQHRTRPVLPDWSQTPLPVGAPSATAFPNTPLIAVA
ncbi:actin family [Hysterangium stoloniferum]|nr:actin family [Hysterangium stoloniferum]